MKIVCLSDTHTVPKRFSIPDGDVLVHAGDLTSRGTLKELEAVADWLRSLPHKYKVIIAGNHDFAFQEDETRARALTHGLIYLCDSGCQIEGKKFWGSPWQPWFYDWAFNIKAPADLAKKWALIPTGIDVLITHGPPYGILDATEDGRLVGCMELRKATILKKPKVHVFGHIHEAYGQKTQDGILYVNASTCNTQYRHVNAPRVIEI